MDLNQLIEKGTCIFQNLSEISISKLFAPHVSHLWQVFVDKLCGHNQKFGVKVIVLSVSFYQLRKEEPLLGFFLFHFYLHNNTYIPKIIFSYFLYIFLNSTFVIRKIKKMLCKLHYTTLMHWNDNTIRIPQLNMLTDHLPW